MDREARAAWEIAMPRVAKFPAGAIVDRLVVQRAPRAEATAGAEVAVAAVAAVAVAEEVAAEGVKSKEQTFYEF